MCKKLFAAMSDFPITQSKQNKPNKRARDSLRWLNDMVLFYEELRAFMEMLPDRVTMDQVSRIPLEISRDARFSNLCRVSLEARYMQDIPYDICRSAMESVQALARESMKTYYTHPLFSQVRPWDEVRPFFERTMILGSALAVEHGMDVESAIKKDRKKRKDGKLGVPLRTDMAAGGGGANSDDEMTFICEVHDIDKSLIFS